MRQRARPAPGDYAVLPLSEVSPDPANEFRHPPRQLERLARALAKYGQQKSIVIGRDRRIIAGEGVYRAALLAGWTHARFKYSDLEGAKRAGYRQADNLSQRLARLDEEILAANLRGLEEAEGPRLDKEALGLDDEAFARALAPGAWHGRVLNPDAIGDYDPDAETFVVKVPGVRPEDAGTLLARLAAALEGTGYAATSS